jgi:hypothetical protein
MKNSFDWNQKSLWLIGTLPKKEEFHLKINSFELSEYQFKIKNKNI